MVEFNLTLAALLALCVALTLAQEFYDDKGIIKPKLRERRQAFGSITSLPMGGHNLQAGVGGSFGSGGFYSGSVSRDFDTTGRGGPHTFNGNVGYGNDRGSVYGGLSKTDGHPATATVGGRLNIINTENHKLEGWVEHSRPIHRRRRQTTGGGLNYEHSSGIRGSASATQTRGLPPTFGLGASVPVFRMNDDRTRLDLGGKAYLTPGRPNQYEVGVSGPLWTSRDRMTSLDLGASRSWSPGYGHSDQIGIGIRHQFG